MSSIVMFGMIARASLYWRECWHGGGEPGKPLASCGGSAEPKKKRRRPKSAPLASPDAKTLSA
jgi:hypothetical protein